MATKLVRDKYRLGDLRVDVVKEWARARGYYGATGGCIYNADGKHVVQGWSAFYTRFRNRVLNDLLAEHYPGLADSFADLQDKQRRHGYVPTFDVGTKQQLLLAMEYAVWAQHEIKPAPVTPGTVVTLDFLCSGGPYDAAPVRGWTLQAQGLTAERAA